MILGGCTVSVGKDHGPGPGTIAANPNLRVVAGHFETGGTFGFGSDASPVGQTIMANGARLRIDAAVADPEDPSGEIVLYHFTRLDANGGATLFCPPDASGRSLGFPMEGGWSPDGTHLHAAGQVSIACLGSAESRCVALGYRPWHHAEDGKELWDYHQACVRALHADYCGTGQSHGEERYPLALYDRIGIQRLRGADGMSFEAAWNANGAACVNHIRAPAQMTLKDLRTECANLPKAHLGNSCDEREPALIFTKSPTP